MPLDQVLVRSELLLGELDALFAGPQFDGFDGSQRGQASVAMCSLALEHGDALRTLFDAGYEVSATSLLRIQYEALTRAIWVMYVASDAQIDKLTAVLTLDNEQAAKNLPQVADMLASLEKAPGHAPRASHQLLQRFRDVQLKSLNSFVHGGIHALRRNADGFPVHLAVQVVQSSNALATMASMALANLAGSEGIAKHINLLLLPYQDCLPSLEPLGT